VVGVDNGGSFGSFVAVVLGLALVELIVFVPLGVVVGRDAQRHGRNGWTWGVLMALQPIIVGIAYLAVRNRPPQGPVSGWIPSEQAAAAPTSLSAGSSAGSTPPIPWSQSPPAQVAGTLIGIAFGLFIFFHLHTGYGVVLAALFPIFGAVNLRRVRQRQAALEDPSADGGGSFTRGDEPTGQTLSPTTDLVLPAAGWTPSYRWVGAANLDTGLRRVNVSTPLAVLELAGRTLTLRVRPAFLGRFVGARPLVLDTGGVELVFPARTRLRTAAIGIRPRRGRVSYFLTAGIDRASILTAAEQSGFPVDWNEYRYSST
jgi:hypothetical protein